MCLKACQSILPEYEPSCSPALRLKMVPLQRPNVWSYNRGRPTSSVSVPSTHVAVDHSLILQLSRLVCPGSPGLHPPLGSARYTCVKVWGGGGGGGGRGQKKCAVLFLGMVCSFFFFHTLSSLECRGCSSLLGAASQLGWDYHRILSLPWSQASTGSTARHHGVRPRLLRPRQLLCCVTQPAGLCTH